MPVPHISTNFGDLLDPRFQKIFHEQFKDHNDMLPILFSFAPDNGRDTMTWSDVGTLDDWTQFEGTVNYDSQSQGFDVTATSVEFVNGIQIERKLFDDDQFNIMAPQACWSVSTVSVSIFTDAPGPCGRYAP